MQDLVLPRMRGTATGDVLHRHHAARAGDGAVSSRGESRRCREASRPACCRCCSSRRSRSPPPSAAYKLVPQAPRPIVRPGRARQGEADLNGLARGEHAAGDPPAAIARRVGHQIVGLVVNDDRRAIGIEQAPPSSRPGSTAPIVPRPFDPTIEIRACRPHAGLAGSSTRALRRADSKWPHRRSAKSGASQRPTVWICAPCVPGRQAAAGRASHAARR